MNQSQAMSNVRTTAPGNAHSAMCINRGMVFYRITDATISNAALANILNLEVDREGTLFEKNTGRKRSRYCGKIYTWDGRIPLRVLSLPLPRMADRKKIADSLSCIEPCDQGEITRHDWRPLK